MKFQNLMASTGEWLRGEGPHHQVVVSSRVRLARNLRNRSFPGWAKKAERTMILELIKPRVEELPEMQEPFSELLQDLSALEDVQLSVDDANRILATNDTRWQTIQVNEKTFETTVEGVFSGGDVVTGADTAIEGIAAGRKAAYAIDRYVATGRAEPEPVEVYSRKDAYHEVKVDDLPPVSTGGRRRMPVLAPAERASAGARA